MKRPVFAVCTLALFSIIGISCSTLKVTPLDIVAELVPVAELTPQEVVEIQLTALKANDMKDRGIEVAYRFASPRNRSLTGNLETFASLLRRGPYAPMLGSGDFEVGPVIREGNLAMVAAWVNTTEGDGTGFVFVLTLQDGGSYHNCWMTDGVLEFSDLDSGDYSLPEMPLTNTI